MSVLTASLSSQRRYDAPRPAIRVVAVAMLVVEIAIHAYLAPDHLREMPYIGWGFVISTVILAAALVGIVVAPRRALPWQIGALVCVGMAVLFVVSRTAGLPSYHEGWTADDNLGLVSLVGDIGFLACVPALGSLLRTRGRRFSVHG